MKTLCDRSDARHWRIQRSFGGSIVLAALAAAFAAGGATPDTPDEPDASPAPDGGIWFDADGWDAQQRLEDAVADAIDPAELRRWHELAASAPHRAGTPGDANLVDALVSAHEAMGLDVERQELELYLARPVSASLDIIAPETITLPVKEAALSEDPDTQRPDIDIGWNAYSGSGEASGPVVYANYGTKEDFEKLAELGVELDGKIVIARYGGNFRGFKAKFAEEAGAAGLVIYTDPEDGGYRKGLPYPEGGYANETSIQRGSIKTLPYPGDPLTPFEPSIPGAETLDPADVALPTIPVQPVGWAAAEEILSRMKGEPAPTSWHGALPFTYRVQSDPDKDGLQVRLRVEQERELVTTHNVVATLRGAERPEELVIIGCHHDAWTFGASDPSAGTMLVLEAARAFAEAAEQGLRPKRSIAFAHWGAEEYGIIGSVEWVEAHRRELFRGAVAYLNLDGAARGPDFGASASPTLKPVILSAAADTPDPRSDEGASVLADWLDRTDDDADERPRFGNLGGGSDHVGFYCHLGVPSAGLSGGGTSGTAYHSGYDTLRWYRQVVGEDYVPAATLTRTVSRAAARLANGDLLPLDPRRYATDTRRHLESLDQRAEALDFPVDFASLRTAIGRFENRAAPVFDRLPAALDEGRLSERDLRSINTLLLSLERVWLHEPGLPERPWFRNLYAATDPNSGYAAWMLPGLRHAIESQDADSLEQFQRQYIDVFRMLGEMMTAIKTYLPQETP